MSLFEGVIHDWDTGARRERSASIPSDWAAQVAAGLPWLLPELAHRQALSEAAGRYLLLVGDDVGPVTITVSSDGATVQAGEPIDSPVTLRLSADAYVRLIAGRYPLRPAIESGEVQVEGDDRRAQSLNAVFAGVAND